MGQPGSRMASTRERGRALRSPVIRAAARAPAWPEAPPGCGRRSGAADRPPELPIRPGVFEECRVRGAAVPPPPDRTESKADRTDALEIRHAPKSKAPGAEGAGGAAERHGCESSLPGPGGRGCRRSAAGAPGRGPAPPTDRRPPALAVRRAGRPRGSRSGGSGRSPSPGAAVSRTMGAATRAVRSCATVSRWAIRQRPTASISRAWDARRQRARITARTTQTPPVQIGGSSDSEK